MAVIGTVQHVGAAPFVGERRRLLPFIRTALAKLISRIGERAGWADTFPQRFRHTFAINYLSNDGDLFMLQALRGRTDLAMVKRYAQIAQLDVANTHRRASPVDNLKL